MGSTELGDKTMALKEILLVDEKAPIISAMGWILQSKGYLVMLAPDAETASEDLENYHFDLMLVNLTEYEAEKLDLLQRAKRSFPQTRVMVMGNPQRMRMPIQAFQLEVDDYLLTPFSAPELCRRVDHCLRKNEVLKLEVNPEEKAVTLNERVLNALRLKFCDINNTLFSLIAHLKIMVQENRDILPAGNFSQINEMSIDLLKLMNIAEDFLFNHLLCNDNNIFENEIKIVNYNS
jgi:response regulator RpfG family c-di-GMP phosphodiesterase